jgi:hypothetical protein
MCPKYSNIQMTRIARLVICISRSSVRDPTARLVRRDFMSYESGGVKVDHACSVPNSCSKVTSLRFGNQPLRARSRPQIDQCRCDAGCGSHLETDRYAPDVPLRVDHPCASQSHTFVWHAPRSVQSDRLHGANLVANEGACVGAQVIGVVPEIAPHRQTATERLVDHSSGEGLEGDRAVVPNQVEAGKKASKSTVPVPR